MSRRRITAHLSGSIVVVRGWQAGDLAREAGIKAVFSGAAAGVGGWAFDRGRMPDLEAYLQSRHIPLVVVDPDQAELDLGSGGA